MTIVLHRRQPTTGESIGGSVGRALGGAVKSGLEMYEKHQKQKELDQGLEQAEKIFADPNLSPQQKQLGLFKALRNNPDLAKTMGAQLSGLGPKALNPYEQAQLEELNEERSFLDQILGGNNKKPTSFSDRLSDNKQPTSNMAREEDFETENEQPEREPTRRETFNYKDPSTWTDKEVNQFRSIEGKTGRAKTLSHMAKNEHERRQESKKAKTKYQESVAPLESALSTIGRMEKLGKKGNLGIGTKVRGVISPQARRDASEYERLGKSLIQFSSNIPIRNRSEFEVLAHDLYDPSISDDSRAGILDAMKRIIESSMQQYEAPEGEDQNLPSSRTAAPSQKQKRPLTSFMQG